MMNSAARAEWVNSFAMRVFGVAALVVVLAAAAWSQAAPSGTVSGTVVGGSGAPVVGIRVTIVSAASSFAPATLSDEKGNFTFRGRPLGAVTVKALDAKGNVLGSTAGTLTAADQVLVLRVTVP